MNLPGHRTLSVSLWVLSLVIFVQAVQELFEKIETVDYWGRSWKVGLPVFIIAGVMGLFAAAMLISTNYRPFGEKVGLWVCSIRERLGKKALVLSSIVILLTFAILYENPWPWIFRWPHTQLFVILFAAFVAITLSYPWVRSYTVSFWHWVDQFKLQPEKLFLVFASCFGLLYFLLIPPLMSPDENAHMFRSWAVSELVLFQDHSTIPKNIYYLADTFYPLRSRPNRVDLDQLIYSQVKQPLNADDRMEIDFRAANVYPAFVYFPQALGIGLGRILNLSPLLIYYFGRLVNFMVWALLGWIALRTTPVYKWAFMVLIFLPMSFYQALSLSPDAITNAAGFLFSAVILRCASDETQKIEYKQMLLLFGASALLALTKIPYFLLTSLMLIISWQKFGTKRKYIYTLIFFFMVTVTFIILANWSSFFSFLSLEQVRKIPPYQQRLSEAFSNPFGIANIIAKTLQTKLEFYYQTLLGVLGWLDTPLPQSMYSVILGAVIFSALTDGSSRLSLKLKNRVWIGLISLACFLVILLLLYLTFTPTGSMVIEGFQGRYLIPISAVFILVFYNQKLSDLSEYLPWASLIYLLWLFVNVANIIAVRYYAF